jgi:hypothetical protein
MHQDKPKSRRGCIFYGCIITSALMLVMLIGVLAALHYGRKLVLDFTDTGPMQLPELPAQMSPAQIEQIRSRVAAFREALRNNRPTPPLELTADEINALIATDPGYQAAKGKVYVSIQDGQLTGQVSLPLDQLNVSTLKGRYLNGSVTFGVSLENGVLRVVPQQITTRNKPLPEWVMRKLRQQNFAQDAGNDPQAASALNQLQAIQLTGGKLILVPKNTQ